MIIYYFMISEGQTFKQGPAGMVCFSASLGPWVRDVNWGLRRLECCQRPEDLLSRWLPHSPPVRPPPCAGLRTGLSEDPPSVAAGFTRAGDAEAGSTR